VAKALQALTCQLIDKVLQRMRITAPPAERLQSAVLGGLRKSRESPSPGRSTESDALEANNRDVLQMASFRSAYAPPGELESACTLEARKSYRRANRKLSKKGIAGSLSREASIVAQPSLVKERSAPRLLRKARTIHRQRNPVSQTDFPLSGGIFLAGILRMTDNESSRQGGSSIEIFQ